MLDIKIYPNIRPLMDSAFGAEAVHVRFCIFTGHNKGSELLVADLILPYLIAAWAAARRAMGTRKGEQET